jgi:hypothetical protein
MKMSISSSKAMQITKFFVDANFYISVIVLVYGGISAITENHSIFEINEDLFGAIHNNLRMALLYLAMTEIVICLYCWVNKQPKMMLFVGYFLLMMMGSMAFYGEINSVPIDRALPAFFLYTGVSHILYGLVSGIVNENNKKRC